MPHHVIVALFLPKRLSGQCQYRIGSLGSDAFNDFVSLGKGTAAVTSK